MLDLYLNIKNERLKNGWNQSEVAKRVGYSDKSMIAKIEAGKVDLPQTKIRAFAQVFGCTESYLMGWSESDDKPSTDVTLFDISNSEKDLVEAWRDADQETRGMIMRILAFNKPRGDN